MQSLLMWGPHRLGTSHYLWFSNFSLCFQHSQLNFILLMFLVDFLYFSDWGYHGNNMCFNLITMESSFFSLLVNLVFKIFLFFMVSGSVWVGIYSCQLEKHRDLKNKSVDLAWMVCLFLSQMTMLDKWKILRHMDRSEYHIENTIFLPPFFSLEIRIWEEKLT